MFNFWSKNPFAIQITDRTVRLMQLKGKLSRCEIVAAAQVELEPGLVKMGEITQLDTMANLLSQAMRQAVPGPTQGKECLLVLDESQVYQMVCYAEKNLMGGDLIKFLEQKIRETLPFSFDQIAYKYQIRDNSDHRMVYVMAIKKQVLNDYANFLNNKCGLKFIGAEPWSQGLLRSWKPVLPAMDQPVILINVDGYALKWSLVWQGLIFDSNSVAIREGGDLTGDLAHSMAFFKEKTGIIVNQILLPDTQAGMADLEKQLSGLGVTIAKGGPWMGNFHDTEMDTKEWGIVAGTALRALDDTTGNELLFQL